MKRDKEERCYDDKGPETCRTCGSDTTLPYWCETCQRPVPEKRCPCCGLKARKVNRRAGYDVESGSRDDA